MQKMLEKRGLDSLIKKEQQEQLIQIQGLWGKETENFILQQLKHRLEMSKQNERDASKLGEILQGIPMALQQAVCFMEEENSQHTAVVEIQEYVQKYVQLQYREKEKMKKNKEKSAQENKNQNLNPNPIYYTFHINLNKLKENDDKDSTFTPIPIQIQILETLVFFPAENVKVQLLFRILNETEMEMEQGIQKLEKYGMIRTRKNSQGNLKFLDIHRKVQSLTLKNMEEKIDGVKSRLEFLISKSIEFLNKNQSGDFLEQMEEILENIQKYSYARVKDFEEMELAILGLKTRISLWIKNNRMKNLLTIFQHLKDNNTFESDKETQNNFVRIFLPTEISSEQILEIQELASDILGDYHPFYLKLLLNFVDISLKNGEYSEAIETTEKILRILDDSPRKNMTLILDTMFKMAEMQVRSNNTGDAVDAFIDLFEKEQEHIIVVSTERKFRTLGAIYNFSMDLAHSGNFEPSLKLLNNLYALQQPKQKKPTSKSDENSNSNSNSNPISETPKNPAILSTLHHMALVKFLEKNYEESLSLFTKVVKSRIKSLGRNHKDTLKSIEGKASALFRLGRYDEAHALYTQVNEVRTRGKDKTKEENLDLASTRYNLARVLIYQGQGQTQEEGKERLADSLKLFLEAYEIQNGVLGPEDPLSLKTLEHICILNVTIGTENEATLGLASLHLIRDLRKFDHGEEDERTLATSVALALGLLIVNHKIDLDYLPQGDSAVFDFLKQVYQTRKEKRDLKSSSPIIPDFEPTDALNIFAHILLSLQGRKKGKGGIQGKVKALDMLTSVHALQEKILGSNDPETMMTLGHRIQLMILQGNSEDGLKLASDLISKNKEKLRKKKRDKQKQQEQEKEKDKKEPVTSNRYPDLDQNFETFENLNLAIITSMELLLRFYNQAPNLYYQEAVILHKDVHELKKAHFGENNGQTLATLVSLAQLHTKLGDWSSAEKVFGDVYKKRKRALGEDHTDTLEALHQSAIARLKQKKLEDAFTLFKQLYESQKKISGEFNEQTVAHLFKMAEIRETQGNAKDDKSLLKEALKLYSQVQKRREKTIGDDHPDTLMAIQSLIRIHTHALLQNNMDALKLLKKVYESQKRSIGANHLDTLATLKKMADLFILQKNHEKAAKFLKRVFRTRKSVLGPLHKDTLSVQEELATLHYTMGHMDDAEDAYLQLYELKKSTPKWGPEHPDTLHTLSKLASLAKEIKNYEESRDLYKKVWEGQKRALGEEHEDYIQTTEILAGLHLGFGDEEESEKLRRLVYNIRRRLLGKENAKTVEAEKNLAMVFLEQHSSKERQEKGLKLLENVYRWQKKSLGEEHPETQNTDQTIKYIKEQLGLNKKEKEDL